MEGHQSPIRTPNTGGMFWGRSSDNKKLALGEAAPDRACRGAAANGEDLVVGVVAVRVVDDEAVQVKDAGADDDGRKRDRVLVVVGGGDVRNDGRLESVERDARRHGRHP